MDKPPKEPVEISSHTCNHLNVVCNTWSAIARCYTHHATDTTEDKMKVEGKVLTSKPFHISPSYVCIWHIGIYGDGMGVEYGLGGWDMGGVVGWMGCGWLGGWWWGLLATWLHFVMDTQYITQFKHAMDISNHTCFHLNAGFNTCLSITQIKVRW